ncbi:MAG: multiprotein bridging factor aMBF1 [Candidatus Micrarchaeaceae archaeon]
MCGAEVNTLYEIEIEGTHMLVCSVCKKGKSLTGRVIEAQNANTNSGQSMKNADSDNANAEAELEIADDYGEIIRKARESLGLPIKVLAEKINEKASMLLRVEEQRTLPSDKLAKKLERELGIKLIKPGQSTRATAGSKLEPISLWDAARKKQKKA